MNRRTFLSGLLALPFAPVVAKLLPPHTQYFFNMVPLPFGRTSDIIAATIETRSAQISDSVRHDNALLRMVDQDWQRSRPYAVGDEVVMGHRVLVCVAAGSTTMKRIDAAQPHLEKAAAGEPALVSTYIVDDVAFDEDHSRTLIRRMRREAGWRYRHSPSAWPFGNGLA